MDLEKKTGLTVSYYDYDKNLIQSWGFQSSIRLALLISTIVGEKSKIELDRDQIEKSVDYIICDLKKFLKTPYEPEDNA